MMNLIIKESKKYPQ